MGTRSGASKKLSGSAMDKLVAGGRLSTDLAQVVHLAFSTTSGAKRPEAFWRELRLPRGRCLEAVDLWELTEHSTGAGLETIEQLRNVSFQGEKQEVSELLGKLRAILPALTVMEVVGVHSELVSCLEVFEGLGHHTKIETM